MTSQQVRIGSIVIHCHEFQRMVAFWSEALGYTPDRPLDGGWVVLRPPEGNRPHLSLQAREVPRAARSWMHLDLYTADQEAEVGRLLELGAKRYPWRYAEGADYVVLEDPDGNLFCVVQAR
ncbi:MAG: VOC family protein [Gemmatimonadota bacterium]